MTFSRDHQCRFPAYLVSGSHAHQRRFVAEHGKTWLSTCARMKLRGAVVFDIDDTLIDGKQEVVRGFQDMLETYQHAKRLGFPVYVVTARPDDDEEYVYGMLSRREIHVTPEHLKMLPAEHYNVEDDKERDELITDFKFGKYLEFVKKHNRVLARFGDKLWDVCDKNTIVQDLNHVSNRHCWIGRDCRQGMCVSYKLPGDG